MNTRFIERVHKEIPLSKAMQVSEVNIDSDRVILAAPLKPNSNHKGTAFGGSIHSLAVLSCWSLINVTLDEERFKTDYLVIQDSEIKYLKPVETDFTAVAAWPDEKSKKAFLRILEKKGTARATLTAEICVGSAVCARLKGRFVTKLK